MVTDSASSPMPRPAEAASDAPPRVRGTVMVLLAFDIGFQIDLDSAGVLARDSTRDKVVRARRPAPVWFDYKPAPLRLQTEGEAVSAGELRSEPLAEALIYDFGGALITFRLPLDASLADLPSIASALYDCPQMLAEARARIESIMSWMRPSIERPALREMYEDYVVFAITRLGDEPAGTSPTPSGVLERHRELLARAVEAEPSQLAPEQVERAIGARMAYAATDLAIVDWNAAILFDSDPDDVLAVLKHANVELLELRVLDEELDALLDHSDETLSKISRRRLWPSFEETRMLRRFASVQTDAAVMFEGVNNAIKLLGNQYLARLYRMAAQRMDLPSWQSSVQRKLGAAESVYQKMSDVASTQRLEVLEWVIIVLIAVSIVLPFTGIY
ncbi:MAG: hypothetical protein ACTS3F_15030 [Phycisphaerales bacterium]